MKQFIFAALLVIPFCSYSQDNFIKGIGPFKIGLATTAIINEIADKAKIKLKGSTSLMDYYNDYDSKKTTGIYLLQRTEKDKDRTDPRFTNHPFVKTFYIDYYEVAEVPIKGIYLRFYNDTLYDFQCDYSTLLREAIDLKYGKGNDSVVVKKVKCNSRLSGDFEEEEKSFHFSWPTGDKNILCVGCIGHYYDYKCEKNYLSYFYVKNSTLSIQINKEVARVEIDQENKLKAEKKSKLSEF